MEKTNYSVARVVTYTKQSISKAERHNERKNQSYSNMNVDLEQVKEEYIEKLSKMTLEERLQYFKEHYCLEQKLNIEKEINGTIYKVNEYDFEKEFQNMLKG